MRTDRKLYLVTYDIADPKRLRRVHKVLRGFGDHLQYSVFLCELSGQRHVELRAALEPIIAARDDQVLMVRLGAGRQRIVDGFLVLGRPLALDGQQARIF